MNIHVQVFVRAPVFNSLGCIPRSGIAGLYGNSMLDLVRNCQTIFQSGASFHILTSNARGFQFLHILANTYFLFFKKIRTILAGVK